MTTRILIADALDPAAFKKIESIGAEIDCQPTLSGDALASAIPGARILVVRSTKVTKEIIDAASHLALIVRAGSGYNNIDIHAANSKGIFVANCPGKNSIAVAELALGLMISLDRNIPNNVIDLRNDRWDKKRYSKARGLKGQKLGLIGFGSIAQAVARRAKAFGMVVCAYSRSLTEEQAEAAGVTRATSLERIFSQNDIVSIHLPLNAKTKRIVDKSLLDLLADQAMFINTSRAELVDPEALLEAAKSGRIRVGTDLFENEPSAKQGKFEDPLGQLDNVIGTHHIGASTTQAQNAIANATVEIVYEFLANGEVNNAVNLGQVTETAATLIVRHLDRVGVLAAVLDRLRRAEINVQKMENLVFEGGMAACARIQLQQWPEKSLIEEITKAEHVIHVEVV